MAYAGEQKVEQSERCPIATVERSNTTMTPATLNERRPKRATLSDDDTTTQLTGDPETSHDGSNIRERRFLVDSNFYRWRLDAFIANRLGRLSRTRANRITRHGDIRIEPPRTIKPSLRLHLNDVVIIREHLDQEHVQDDEALIVYQDDAIIAISKPAGMLTHQTASQQLNTAEAFLRRAGFDGAEAVHRLDRETSGLLLCTHRRELIHPLRQLFASDHPRKIYRALALDPDGRWPLGATATLREPLGQAPGPLAVRMGHGELSATTHVTCLNRLDLPRFGPAADLAIEIETGRQHQIRVHLFMQGTPIAGDKLYGQTDQFFMDICDRPDDRSLLDTLPFPRHALHAWQLIIPHPITQRPITLEAPLPTDIWPE
jgi:RluA family pseudouridine synthase